MFKYCIWYKIFDERIINLILRLSTLFNTQSYHPHLTLFSKLDKNRSDLLYKKFKKEKIPNFKKLGRVYQTSENNFHAIQQDFIDSINNNVFHISLAYRNFKGFTEEELFVAENNFNIDFINCKNIKVSLYNCDSRFTKDWKIIAE